MRHCESCSVEISVYSRWCKVHADERRRERDRNRKRQQYQDGSAYQKVKDSQAAIRETKREWVCEYLMANPCMDCGQKDITVLDFDHRNDSGKHSNVTVMMNNGTSLKKMITEVEKCDIRCANCHRKKSNKRFGGTYRERFMTRQDGPERTS